MVASTAANQEQLSTAQRELAEELRQAERDFANGDFVEVTVEELDQCIAAGRWPWPDGSANKQYVLP